MLFIFFAYLYPPTHYTARSDSEHSYVTRIFVVCFIRFDSFSLHFASCSQCLIFCRSFFPCNRIKWRMISLFFDIQLHDSRIDLVNAVERARTVRSKSHHFKNNKHRWEEKKNRQRICAEWNVQYVCITHSMWENLWHDSNVIGQLDACTLVCVQTCFGCWALLSNLCTK